MPTMMLAHIAAKLGRQPAADYSFFYLEQVDFSRFTFQSGDDDAAAGLPRRAYRFRTPMLWLPRHSHFRRHAAAPIRLRAH